MANPHNPTQHSPTQHSPTRAACPGNHVDALAAADSQRVAIDTQDTIYRSAAAVEGRRYTAAGLARVSMAGSFCPRTVNRSARPPNCVTSS